MKERKEMERDRQNEKDKWRERQRERKTEGEWSEFTSFWSTAKTFITKPLHNPRVPWPSLLVADLLLLITLVSQNSPHLSWSGLDENLAKGWWGTVVLAAVPTNKHEGCLQRLSKPTKIRSQTDCQRAGDGTRMTGKEFWHHVWLYRNLFLVRTSHILHVLADGGPVSRFECSRTILYSLLFRSCPNGNNGSLLVIKLVKQTYFKHDLHVPHDPEGHLTPLGRT